MPEEMTTELAECSRRRGRSHPDFGEGGGGGASCREEAAGAQTEAKEAVFVQGRGASAALERQAVARGAVRRTRPEGLAYQGPQGLRPCTSLGG